MIKAGRKKRSIYFKSYIISVLFGFTFSSSCYYSDDSPCNGAEYVYYLRDNVFFKEFTKTDTAVYRFEDYQKGEVSFLKFELVLDTPFVNDFFNTKYCYDCDYVIETFNMKLENEDFPDKLMIAYAECPGFNFYVNDEFFEMGKDTFFNFKNTTIVLSPDSGFYSLTRRNEYKLQRVK